jgi:shikimate 5-dehydrogenase
MPLGASNPFSERPPPVCGSVAAIEQLVGCHPGCGVCLYLGDRSPRDWADSLSVRYVNRLLGSLIYVPVNVAAGDREGLREVYRYARAEPRVVAINHAQPHKSSPELRSLVGSSDRVDFVAREGGSFRGYDLNGPAFLGWLLTEMPSLDRAAVVLLGVGGAGEAIARAVAARGPAELVLVDPADRSELAASLAETVPTRYAAAPPQDTAAPQRAVVLVNAAGDAGSDAALGSLAAWQADDRLFADLRVSPPRELLAEARRLGWRAHSGEGMNLHNDHRMLEKLAALAGEKPPTFAALARAAGEIAPVRA